MHASSLELPDDDAGCVGEDELRRFVGGAVERGRADEIRAHVDVCDDCREGLGIAGQEAAAAAPATPSEDRDRDGSWRIEVGSEVDGRFVIDREIGRGGMGVVYAATHLSMRRSVALEVLNEKTAEDGQKGHGHLAEHQAHRGRVRAERTPVRSYRQIAFDLAKRGM